MQLPINMTTSNRESPVASCVLMTLAILVIGLAFVLRLWHLPVGMDLREPDQIGYQVIAENFRHNWKPTYYGEGYYGSGFLYMLLGYLVSIPLADTLLGIRLPSWGAALAIAVALWCYGRYVGSARLAIFAAVIFSLMPLSVYYSRQGLSDMLTALWLFLWLWALDAAISSHRRIVALVAGVIFGLLTLTKWPSGMMYCILVAFLLAAEQGWAMLRNREPGSNWLPASKRLFTAWGGGRKACSFFLGAGVIIGPPVMAFFLVDTKQFSWTVLNQLLNFVPFLARLVRVVGSFIPNTLFFGEGRARFLEVIAQRTSVSWLEHPNLLLRSLFWYPYRLPMWTGGPGLFLFLVGALCIVRWRRIEPIRVVRYYPLLLLPLLLSTFTAARYFVWFLPALALVSALGADTLLKWWQKQQGVSIILQVVLAVTGLLLVVWMVVDAQRAWQAHVQKDLLQQLRVYLVVEKRLPKENTVVFSDYWPININVGTGYHTTWLSTSRSDALGDTKRYWVPENQMQYLYDFGGVVVLSSFDRDAPSRNWEFRRLPYDYARTHFAASTRLVEHASSFPHDYGEGNNYFDVYLIPPYHWHLLLQQP